jgi:hypothetical protein
MAGRQPAIVGASVGPSVGASVGGHKSINANIDAVRLCGVQIGLSRVDIPVSWLKGCVGFPA